MEVQIFAQLTLLLKAILNFNYFIILLFFLYLTIFYIEFTFWHILHMQTDLCFTIIL